MEDFDLGWRKRAASAWRVGHTMMRPQLEARPLSIFGGVLSIVPRAVCFVRDHHRGILRIEDGRILEIRGSVYSLRCRFCGAISPGWKTHN